MNERKQIFDFFNSFQNPLVAVTAKVDCNNFLPWCKIHKISSFQWTLYALTKASMMVPEFRWRILDGRPYEVKHVVPSYTVMRENGLFNYASFRLPEDFSFQEFLHLSLQAKAKAEKATRFCDDDDMSHRDYIFVTCLPQLNFTSVSHPFADINDCTIPCFAIGQFQLEQEKGASESSLSFSLGIQAHHGFVDGLHLSQFVQCFIEELNKAKEDYILF